MDVCGSVCVAMQTKCVIVCPDLAPGIPHCAPRCPHAGRVGGGWFRRDIAPDSFLHCALVNLLPSLRRGRMVLLSQGVEEP